MVNPSHCAPDALGAAACACDVWAATGPFEAARRI
jgi:hypothetical protein